MTAADELRSNQPVQDFEIVVCHRHRAARAQAMFRESLVEVVADFSFNYHVGDLLVAHASAYSRHIRTGLRYPEIIPSSADLTLMLRLSQRHKVNCQEQ